MPASKAVLGYGTLIGRRATTGTTTVALAITHNPVAQAVTPGAMTGIIAGSVLAIGAPGAADYEIVVVTAKDTTTFSGIFARDHATAVVVSPMVAIAELFKLGGPNQKQDTKDSSNFTSPAGYKEFIAGMKEGGDVSIEGAYLSADATQVQLQADFKAGTRSDYSIVWPAPLEPCWFNAIVTAIQPSTPLDDRVTFSSTLKVSGPVGFPTDA